MRQAARKLKHRAWVHFLAAERRAGSASDALARRMERFRRPIRFKPGEHRRMIFGVQVPRASTFPVDHLAFHDAVEWVPEARPVPRKLYLLWTGTNDITPNREHSIRHLRDLNSDLEVHLVTPANLGSYVVEGHPLHPAYENLSAVHRSDYLRAYIMHHHGGAYCDIKKFNAGVSGFFEMLDANDSLWMVGMEESSGNNLGSGSGPIGRLQRRRFASLPSQAAHACRPGTPLTEEWVNEVERRLDYFRDLLEERPATDPFGTNDGYPVSWFALLGAVLHPLSVKYHSHVRVERSVRLVPMAQADYR